MERNGVNNNGLIKYHLDDPNHLIRQRINTLFINAIKNPILTVCAGGGCGKTQAVYDFIKQQDKPAIWIRLSERDNDPLRFWDSFTDAAARLDISFSDSCREIGFPDTPDKLNKFVTLVHRGMTNNPSFIVIDDFHLAREPAVLHFIERAINEVSSHRTIILICRELPKIGIKALQIKGFLPNVNETELDFTEDELTLFFRNKGLPADRHFIREIFNDTKGWALAVNLAARSLKRAPNYSGYVKITLKQNIFELMEIEVWNTLHEHLKRFLIRLSLIDHPPAELVGNLAAGDEALLSGLSRQNSYIRYDSYGGVYIVQRFFLDFLRSKQSTLTDEERHETYRAAADWYNKNSFTIDALGYYEKIGDYKSIVLVYAKLLEHTTYEISLYAAEIFKRAPFEIFDRVDFLCPAYLHTLLYLGRWKDFYELAEIYEKKYLSLPGENTIRDNILCCVYYLLGYARLLSSTADGCYDFDVYYQKSADFFEKTPSEPLRRTISSLGAWISTVGCAEAGAPQEYSAVLAKVSERLSRCFNSAIGMDDLCAGELKFYQGDIREAESLFLQALEKARRCGQFETIHRALFYIMRISIIQGNRAKTGQAMKDIEALLDENGYRRRFITYDIASGWYYCVIRQPETIPDWLKGDFAPYSHAYFIENLGNQIKARYYFLTRKYLPLLSYIGEMRQRESILYGRIEMLAMEACVHYHMKNKGLALGSLKEAYEAAAPNGILTPFIELGRDMRTLIMAALREDDAGVPRSWLELIRHKATSYAKNQSKLISEYNVYSGGGNALSSREQDVLSDLYHGLSQTEIATKQSLSTNTVKMVTKSIYEKLNVHKISDLIRVAVEQRLV